MTSRIATKTRRQTMDWSLVLVSQGIEAVVDHNAEAGWSLLVEERDAERAKKILEHYQAENCHWPWQQKIVAPAPAFDWGSLAWVFLLCLFFWLSGRSENFLEAGVMRGAAVTHGEWWRLFTAVFLHADLGHLAGNAVIGIVLLGLAMGRFGTGLGLLAAFLAGVLGNVASFLAHPDNLQSLGASGMVMGCLGLLAAPSFSIREKSGNVRKLMLTGLAAGVLLFVLMGLSPGTDVVAHLGGFAGGILFGAPLTFAPKLGRSAAVNLTAGAVFSALTIVSWRLAVAAGGR